MQFLYMILNKIKYIGITILNYIKSLFMVIYAFVWTNRGDIVKGAVVLAIVALVFGLGWHLCKRINPTVIHNTDVVTTVKEVKVPVEGKTQTVVQYVEKESEKDSDVQISTDKPKVVVDFNGQQTEFNTLDTEEQKFENGKLKVEQTSKTVLDVTPIVEREVQTAVEKNTSELTAQHEQEVKDIKKDESKKRKKNAFEFFVAGVGTALLIGLF